FAGSSSAGGKRDGQSCHVSKSCASHYCITLNPSDKFGVCCTPQGCPEQNAQCGEIGNACGVPIQCGSCDPGSTCVNNQCVVVTTTTTSSTTTSSTTTSSTTTSSTTTTTSTTSTTLIARSCVGNCVDAFPQPADRVVPPGDGPDCYCDQLACGADGCADFFSACVVQPPFLCD